MTNHKIISGAALKIIIINNTLFSIIFVIIKITASPNMNFLNSSKNVRECTQTQRLFKYKINNGKNYISCELIKQLMRRQINDRLRYNNFFE
ncbi:unnamed protein product [Meloidogyne enterolobii]|uniref:Uncharacterized protein n=1 Tax=Meloidogyne enterolobii TaxID=390850 RepID=A0ACB0ZHR1_MELEN